MRILAVDSETAALERLKEALAELQDDAELMSFTSSPEALAAARGKEIDIALLDPELPELSGLDLGQYLQEMTPGVNLIFLSRGRKYAYDALERHASGYVLKPVTPAGLRRELEDLRHPVEAGTDMLTVQAFGNFEVFYQGRPLVFRYSKTKEMLAYLVDRQGALVSGKEIQAVLWENSNEDKSSYYKQLRKDLFDTIRETGCRMPVVGVRGALGIIPANIACDYYSWLRRTPQELDMYQGEYMTQYSWAEATHGSLEMRKYL